MNTASWAARVFSIGALALAAIACGSSSGDNLKNDGSGGSAGAGNATSGCDFDECVAMTGNAQACATACGVGGQGGTGNTGNVGGGGTGNTGNTGAQGGMGNTGNIGGSAGAGNTGNVGGGGTGGLPPGPTGTCSEPAPPGAQAPPPPRAYSGGACPALMPGFNDITSTGNDRRFYLVVPENVQPDENLPIIFMWHWLQGEAQDFLDRGEVQQAANDKRFIAVLPEKKGDVGFPIPLVPLDLVWPYDIAQSDARMEEEFVFFDDMLACVAEQFNTNLSCVSSAGVSAGALWTSQLQAGRGEYLSSIIVLSGGTGGQWIKPYQQSPHKMPALVLWGGPTDVCGIIIRFADLSMDLEANLVANGHFVVECVHNCGHGEPPLTPPGGVSKFEGLWQFGLDHPYWLADGDSPWLQTGVPATAPPWCAIGAGNSVPRMDPTCDEPGCPL